MRLYKFLGVLAILLIIPLASASSSCTSSNYNDCWFETYSGGDATAYSKIESSVDERDTYYDSNFWHYLDYYQLSYKCTGDKAYLLDGRTTNVNLNTAYEQCTINGCPFSEIPLEGSTALTGQLEGLTLLCWDYDFANEEADWAWTVVTSTYMITNVRTVECFEDSNCGSSITDYCDKTGDWTTWSCEKDLCRGVTCEPICYSSTTLLKDATCSEGQCINGVKETCDDNNPLTLEDTCSVINDVAKCSYSEEVDCISDAQCDDNDKFTVTDWCEANICKHTAPVDCITDEDCLENERCEDNLCREETTIEETIDNVVETLEENTGINSTVVLIGIVSLLILIVAIVYLIKKKK